MYFGGIWGGQLQQWESGEFDPKGSFTDLGVANNPAIMPRMAKLKNNMLEFDEEVKEIQILNKSGSLYLQKSLKLDFLKLHGSHKLDVYYLSYSTGDTHI